MTTSSIPDGYEDLTRDGALIKTILVEGDGETAGRGARVAVKYSLRLERNAEPFDTSEKRPDGIFEFTVGRKKVIPALELLVQSMKMGEKSRAIAQSPYAFGQKGLQRKGVPANAQIYVEVELIRLDGGPKKKPFADMTPAERFQEAKDLKESGNVNFKELKYESAVTQYSQSIRYLTGIYYKPSGQLINAQANSLEEDSKEHNTDDEDEEDKTQQLEKENEGDETGFQEATITESQDDQKAEEVTEVIDISSNTTKDADESEDVSAAGENDTTETTDPKIPAATEESKEEESKEEESASSDPERSEVRTLHVTTLNNLSLCLLKMEEYKRAVETASAALQMNSESHKAFYYR